MSTPEHKIKAKVNRALDKLPGVYRFMPVQNGLGAPALDYYLCAYGKFIAVETKAPGKKPTARQYLTIEKIRNAAGLVFVVDDDLSLGHLLNALKLLKRLQVDGVPNAVT